jgi:hypothetical protein
MNQRASLLAVGGLIVLAGIATGAWLLRKSTGDAQVIVSSPPASVDHAAPATGEVGAPARPRTIEEIRAEISQINEQLAPLGAKNLLSAAGRETADRQALMPLLRQQLEIGRELAPLDLKSEAADKAMFALLILGDAEATAAVNIAAASATPAAARAQSVRAMADYVLNESHPDRQILAVDQFFETLKAAGNDPLLVSRISLFAEAIPASPAVTEHLMQRIDESVPEPRKTKLLDRLKKTDATN